MLSMQGYGIENTGQSLAGYIWIHLQQKYAACGTDKMFKAWSVNRPVLFSVKM